MNHNFYDYVYAAWAATHSSISSAKLLLLLWQLFCGTNWVAGWVESYYYFNNFPTLLRLSGASEGRVIQKQFVEIKFDYVYCAPAALAEKLSSLFPWSLPWKLFFNRSVIAPNCATEGATQITDQASSSFFHFPFSHPILLIFPTDS